VFFRDCSVSIGDWAHNGAADIIVLLANPHLDPLPNQGEADAKAPVRVQFESIAQGKQFRKTEQKTTKRTKDSVSKTFLSFVSFC
jgi:hypothetical protein